MKKLKLILPLLLLSALLFTLPVSAALTQKQQDTLTAFVDQFLEDGNAAHKLVYGSVNNYLGINLFLNPITASTAAASYHLPKNSVGINIPGNYLVLDCSAFFELMYREVFGIQMTYVYRGMYAGGHHASNWPAKFFFQGQDKVEWQNENIMKVTSLDGKCIDLFETVFEAHAPKGSTYAMNQIFTSAVLEKMQVGDGIVYIDANTSALSGHFMIYAGDGVLWHSTSTDMAGETKYTMRRQAISSFGNRFTDLVVVRLNDGILEPDFAGYNVPVNFASLSTSSSSFDKNPPYFESIDVKKNGSYYELTVKASDSYGKLKPLSYWYEPDVLYKMSGQGESGILGIFMNRTGETPEICYAGTNKGGSTNAFISDRTTKKTITRVQTAVQILNEIGDVYTDGSVEHTNLPLTNGKTADGRTIKYNAPLAGTSDDTNYGPRLTDNVNYYLWCKDAAQNISTRLRIRFENGFCRIWSSPEGEPETILARIIFDRTRYPFAASDVNADKKIDLMDAIRVAAHLNRSSLLLSDQCADTDGDGSVTVKDVIRVLNDLGKNPGL